MLDAIKGSVSIKLKINYSEKDLNLDQKHANLKKLFDTNNTDSRKMIEDYKRILKKYKNAYAILPVEKEAVDERKDEVDPKDKEKFPSLLYAYKMSDLNYSFLFVNNQYDIADIYFFLFNEIKVNNILEELILDLNSISSKPESRISFDLVEKIKCRSFLSDKDGKDVYSNVEFELQPSRKNFEKKKFWSEKKNQYSVISFLVLTVFIIISWLQGWDWLSSNLLFPFLTIIVGFIASSLYSVYENRNLKKVVYSLNLESLISSTAIDKSKKEQQLQEELDAPVAPVNEDEISGGGKGK